eukprot:g27346.t1
MIAKQLGKCSVNVDVISEPNDEGDSKRGGWWFWPRSGRGPGGWMVLEITAAASRVPGALQTPFPPPDEQNVRKVRLEINSDADLKGCQFVLHKKPNEWLKNGSTNFLIDFAKVAESRSFRDLVTEAAKQQPTAKVSCYSSSGVEVAIIAAAKGGHCDVDAIVRTDRDAQMHKNVKHSGLKHPGTNH